MRYRALALSLLACAGMGVGCYTSHPVEADAGPCGGDVDPADPPWHGGDARVWVRTEGSGSTRRYQAIVLDSIDPGSVTCNANVVLIEATPEGALVQEVGRTIDDGQTLRLVRRYRYDPEAGTPVLDREGAVLDTLAEEHAFEAHFMGDTLTVRLDGTERTYDNLMAYIAALDTASQAGAEEIARLLYFGLVSSWGRIEGWGSTRMLDYVGDPATGACGLRGEVDTTVSAGASTEITTSWSACLDYREISLAGGAHLTVSVAGDGQLSGSVVYTLVPDPAAPLTTITGTLYLDGLEITGLVVSGGTATLRVGVLSFVIDATVFQGLEPW